MSEDRIAAAALAIERYIAGLREELSLLGAVESADLLGDVRDMLLDAAQADPERAFAEMDRLGEPSALAATLLAERGITHGDGMPSAAWWRLGVAAFIDILVGVALPFAAVVVLYSAAWIVFGPVGANTASAVARTAIPVVLLSVFAVAVWLTWRFWTPWRTGGPTLTPGMTLTGISVLKLGGTRTVVPTRDLAAAGLPVPRRNTVGASVSVAVAVLAVAWSISFIAGGALDPSGAGTVQRLAGSQDSQRSQVTGFVRDLYQAASPLMLDAPPWPPVSDGVAGSDGRALDSVQLEALLSRRFAVVGDGGTHADYSVDGMSSPAPGVWTVQVTEKPRAGGEVHARLTYILRVAWTPEGGSIPEWVLTGYDASQTPPAQQVEPTTTP